MTREGENRQGVRISGQIEVAPKKQTCELRTGLLPLELHRTPITEGLMEALPAIEHLDIFSDHIPGFRVMGEAPVMHQFILQRTEEALHWSVIIAVAFSTQ
jgi:hypothetical protein